MSWLRRIRGMLGLASLWGVAGATVGLGYMLVESLQFGMLPLLQSTMAAVTGFGLLGFVSGGAFAGVFSLAEHRRRFEELSVGRAAGWGFLTGALLTAGSVALAAFSPSVYLGGSLGAILFGTAVLSAISGTIVGSLAACTMLLARAAPDDQRALGAGDQDVSRTLR